MRRWALYIVLFWTLGAAAVELTGVPCGAKVRLRATSPEGWHFDHWSDGSTDSVYVFEVRSDTSLIAYFAPNCGTFFLPVETLYDRLLVLDIRSIQASGYFFEPSQVTWYRVKGEPDMPEVVDDEAIGTGYYYASETALSKQGGEYYALVDMSETPSGELCDILRSMLVAFSAPDPEPEQSARKVLRDQQLLIIRGEEIYTIDGKKVK